MWQLAYPILIIVASNVVYNVCAKSTPAEVNAFASLCVTYAVAAAVCFVMFFITAKERRLAPAFSQVNWSAAVLGLVIVGLEVGYILAYRNGWKMNLVSVTANIILAVALVAVAAVFYRETITARQIAGIAVCIGGLLLISL